MITSEVFRSGRVYSAIAPPIESNSHFEFLSPQVNPLADLDFWPCQNTNLRNTDRNVFEGGNSVSQVFSSVRMALMKM
jgi:hypothetical protein